MIGVAYAAFRRQPADWILLAFLLIYFLVIGTGGSVFFPYADPMIPALLLLGGRALADLVRHGGNPAFRHAVLAGVILPVLAPPPVHDLRYDLLIQQTHTRALAY